MTSRRRRSVPAIFAIGLAAVCAAQPSRGDDCLSKPNGPSPPGSHWYYRLERATQRQCWYLGAEGTKARQQVREVPPPARSPAAKAVPQVPAPPTPESAAAEVAPAASTVAQALTAQAATPLDLSARGADPAPRVAALDHAPPAATDGTGDEQSKAEAQDEMPLIWPVLTAQDLQAAEQTAAPAIPFGQLAAALIAVLGLVALIVRLVFMLTVGRGRDQRKVGERARSAVRRDRVRTLQTIHDPADMEASVRVLLHQLRQHEQHRQRDFELPSRRAMA
jgi:hypothetical protein